MTVLNMYNCYVTSIYACKNPVVLQVIIAAEHPFDNENTYVIVIKVEGFNNIVDA